MERNGITYDLVMSVHPGFPGPREPGERALYRCDFERGWPRVEYVIWHQGAQDIELWNDDAGWCVFYDQRDALRLLVNGGGFSLRLDEIPVPTGVERALLFIDDAELILNHMYPHQFTGYECRACGGIPYDWGGYGASAWQEWCDDCDVTGNEIRTEQIPHEVCVVCQGCGLDMRHEHGPYAEGPIISCPECLGTGKFIPEECRPLSVVKVTGLDGPETVKWLTYEEHMKKKEEGK